MSRHYEKNIKRSMATQAAVGAPPEQVEPSTRAQVESFVKGFGIKGAAAQRMVDEWMADQQRARDAGWEAHADGVYYDGLYHDI